MCVIAHVCVNIEGAYSHSLHPVYIHTILSCVNVNQEWCSGTGVGNLWCGAWWVCWEEGSMGGGGV